MAGLSFGEKLLQDKGQPPSILSVKVNIDGFDEEELSNKFNGIYIVSDCKWVKSGRGPDRFISLFLNQGLWSFGQDGTLTFRLKDGGTDSPHEDGPSNWPHILSDPDSWTANVLPCGCFQISVQEVNGFEANSRCAFPGNDSKLSPHEL